MINLQFNLKYFILTIVIFMAEVLIATKLKGLFFVRAYLGDVIVVMLIYTFIKSFFEVKSDRKLIFGIFIFSCIIEFAQYFNIAERLGFRPGSLMFIVIGNSFSWIDILCYGAGCLILFVFVVLQSNEKNIT